MRKLLQTRNGVESTNAILLVAFLQRLFIKNDNGDDFEMA
jgi:hypothetical protein